MKFLKEVLLFLFVSCGLVHGETIIISAENENARLNDKLYKYEDKTGSLSIDDVVSIKFDKYDKSPNEINLGHSKSSFWFKFTIYNRSKERLYYILGVENPGIDEIDLYEFRDGILAKKVIAGESRGIDQREIRHRHFLLKSQLKPDVEYTYYIKAQNNGDELSIPIVYEKAEPYFTKDEKQLLILGLFNGLFFMIVVFTFYLFIRLKEPVYLYYSLYVLLSTLFVLGGDGLTAYLMPPMMAVKIKMMFLHFSMFFLILFTQSFYKSSKYDSFHFPLYFNFLKVISILGAIVTYLPYPYRLSTIYIGTITAPVIFITVVLVSIILYKKEYFTSFYTLAFFFSLFAVVIYILFDYGFLNNNLLTKNSLRIGKTMEGIFLTLAIVERFKYNDNQDKILLQDGSDKIEKQKEILQEINKELEKLSIVASETDNAIAIFNEHTEIEWCNAAFERLYEMSYDQIIKEYGQQLIDISDHEDIQHIVKECIGTKKSVRYQSNHFVKSKKEFWTQTTLTPYFDDQGKLVKLISIDTNITQLKEVQKELIKSRDKAEESDKLKSAFLSNISHEIRTPLNAILGFTELLLLNRGDEDKRKKYLELVRNNGRHLLKLISDIIDISRIEAGEIKLDLFKGNINKLLKEIHDHYKVELDANLSREVELRFHFDLDDNKSEVFADHHKIRQVFSNLLNNAIKFTVSGFVEMGYHLEGRNMKFYVKDTGIGIEENQQRVIFERFRQVESGLSRKFEGAGLGLTLSKGLIEKMGGNISVQSEIGKGSIFYFNIPYEPVSFKESELETDGGYKTYDFKGKKILVVEDTISSRELIHEMLMDTGAEVTDAEDGNQALKHVNDQEFDVILMDIRLPDINGYDVTRLIRKFNKKVYIIAQTANAMDDERKKCFEAGCDNYIAKPFNSDNLLSIINDRFNTVEQEK